MRNARSKKTIKCVIAVFVLVVHPCFTSFSSASENQQSNSDYPLMAIAAKYGPVDPNGRRVAVPYEARSYPMPESLFFIKVQPRSDGTEQESILREWNTYVGGKIERYRTLVMPDLSLCESPRCNPDSLDHSYEEKEVRKLIVKETANFAKDKEPWIDTIVRLTMLQIRHNASREVTLRSVKDPGPPDMSDVLPRKTEQSDFSFKGGLKTNFIDASISFVAEAKARYRKLTTVYRLDFAKHTSIVGLEYPLAGMLVEFRHESGHAASAFDRPDAPTGGSSDWIKLVYYF